MPVLEPRRGENLVAVGKGTFLVSAAHGWLSLDPPTLKGSNARPFRAEVLMPAPALNRKTVDAFRVGIVFAIRSVGGGHKKRALAHGY